LEDELTTARAAAAEAVLLRDRQTRECTYQKDQLVELEKRNAEVCAETDALTQRLALVEAECLRLQDEDGRMQSESEHTSTSLKTAEEAYAQKLTAALEAEAEIEQVRAELLKQTAFSERLHEIARQLGSTLERLSLQAEGLAREGERATHQYGEKRSEAERFSEEVKAARAHITQLSKERDASGTNTLGPDIDWRVCRSSISGVPITLPLFNWSSHQPRSRETFILLERWPML
jgi:chromosome segregation ATPase